MKTWHTFAFLIVAAIIWYVFGRLVLVLAAAYLLFKLWLWIGWRYPMVAWFIIGFLRGLR